MPKAATRSLYSVHPSVRMVQDWLASLKEKTGRSLDEWTAHIRKAGPKEQGARLDWLKKEHGLGSHTAMWLAERSVGKRTWDDDPAAYLKSAHDYVEAMYAGGKAGLRP